MLFYIIISLIIIYCIYDFIYKNLFHRELESPLALPIFGHFLHIKNEPHLVFEKDSKKYNNGKFVKYWFSDLMVLAIFDSSFMKQVYLKNWESVNSRVRSPTHLILSEKYRGIVTANQYYWEFHHNILSKSFSGRKIKSTISSIEQETKHIIEYMKSISKSGQPFETGDKFMNFYSNILFDYVFSRRIENIYDGIDKEQNQIILAVKELFDSLGVSKIQNFLKITQPFYYLYFKIFGHPSDSLKRILFKYYKEHCDTIDFNNPRDVLDSMIIEYRKVNGKEEENSIIAISNELVLAGTETNSTTSEWFMINMVNYPEYQDKIYNELLQAIKEIEVTDKSDVKISLQHRPLTPLFNATLKETMRLTPTVPFSVPRESIEDFEVDGIKIPKGTYIIPSFYSMFRDENHYDNPNEFVPERFLYDSHSSHYFPYSIGPRMCLGMGFSQDELYISLTNILLNFKIKSVDGKPINEKPKFGLTFRPNEYKLLIEPR